MGIATAPRADGPVYWPYVFAAIYAASWAFTIQTPVGRLYVAEVVCLLALPFIGALNVFARYPTLRFALLAYALLFLGLVISDFVNQTETRTALRGWATPGFAAVELLVAVAIFHRRPTALVVFLLVTFIAKAIFGEAGFQSFGAFAIDDPNYFKVRYASAVFAVNILIACLLYRRSGLYAAIYLAIAGLVIISWNGRSLGTIAIIASAILVIRHFNIRMTGPQFLTVAVALTGVAYLAYLGYIDYALTRVTTDRDNTVMQIMRMKNPYNPLEFLLFGRSEWTIFTAAMSEKPVFGYGSWAVDVGNRFNDMRATVSNDVISDTGSIFNWKMIPVHSIVGTSWIWAGLLGFLGALILLGVLVTAFMQSLRIRHFLFPAALIFGLHLLFDFFFSPLQTLRLTFPHGLGFLIVMAAVAQTKSRQARILSQAARDALAPERPAPGRRATPMRRHH